MVVVTRTPGYLEHHGIQGQKWGVRNGPPYPLDYEQHNSSEKSKNPKGSLDNYENNNPKSKASGSNDTKAKRSAKTGEVNTKQSSLDKTSSKKAGRQVELTEEEIQKRRETAKKVIIAAAVTIGLGAACYVAYKRGAVDYIKKGLAQAAKNGVELSKDQLDDLVKEAADASLDDIGYTIKQGDEIHRMHAWKEFDLNRTAGKGTYVSINDLDRDAYMAYLKDWHDTGERYDITMMAKHDINIPTEEAARKLFQKFYDNNPEYRRELHKTLIKSYEKAAKQADLNPVLQKVGARLLAKGQLKNDPFKAGVYTIVKGQKDSQMLFDMYQKVGYDAIVDYFDKGTVSNMPVILFDAKNDISVVGSKFVTEAMKEAAVNNLALNPSHPMYSKAVNDKQIYDLAKTLRKMSW